MSGPCLFPAPAPNFYHYNSNNTNNSYILSTYTNYSHAAAQAYCNSKGGHLAVWASFEEQQEVEQYYINQVCSSAACIARATA
jgi:hypothetical protein